MKNLLASAAAFALLLSGSIAAVPTVAQADPVGPVITDYCKTDSALSYFGSVGACVSAFRTSAEKVCKAADEAGLLDDYGFKNRGDCVSWVKANFY